MTLDDIRRFRQLDSKAPGHPEYRWVSGVETTTGPLGQGVATSVGMAIAEKWLAHRYNLAGNPRQNGGRVAGCTADIEQARGVLDFGELDQLGQGARRQKVAGGFARLALG